MTQLEEQAGAGQLDVARHRSDYGGTMARGWHLVAIAVAAIAGSFPRRSGPIDLRWNAGVYYLLGTSLAQGHGYTMLSERRLPHAIELKFAASTRDLKLRQPVYPPV